jgi:hypothetical protein
LFPFQFLVSPLFPKFRDSLFRLLLCLLLALQFLIPAVLRRFTPLRVSSFFP